jgi:hypothetical protein
MILNDYLRDQPPVWKCVMIGWSLAHRYGAFDPPQLVSKVDRWAALSNTISIRM